MAVEEHWSRQVGIQTIGETEGETVGNGRARRKEREK